jgi:LemA protein
MPGGLVIVTLVLAGLVLWALRTFNRLVRARNLARASWSDIDVQLQRRHDLIPRLVEAVKAYASYERTTLEAVTELRARSLHTHGLGAKAAIEDEIEAATHRLIALAESYPDLKADRNFRELQTELADTEDQLQYARRFYNGAVRDYNTGLQSFPDLLLARPLNFREQEFFSAEERAAAPVSVSLD